MLVEVSHERDAKILISHGNAFLVDNSTGC